MNRTMSGLGISFVPEPPPLPRAVSNLKRTSHHELSRSQSHQELRGTSPPAASASMPHSAMQSVHSEESAASSGRRVRIASGTPMILGEMAQHYVESNERGYYDSSPPFSVSNSSRSGTTPSSMTSVSSVPSSQGSFSECISYPYSYEDTAGFAHPQSHTLRHAQSIGVLPSQAHSLQYHGGTAPQYHGGSASQMYPYYTGDERQHRHQAHDTHGERSGQRPEQQGSRVPPFIVERSHARAQVQNAVQRRPRAGTLSRPKSMLELGEMAAARSIEERKSDTLSIVHSRYYHPAPLSSSECMTRTESGGSKNMPAERSADYESYDDAVRDVDGDGSPESSVPSSAGGLYQRQLERQLERIQAQARLQAKQLSASTSHPSIDAARESARHGRSRSMTFVLPSQTLNRPRSQSQGAAANAQVLMRSFSSMRGLEPAETGGSFVEFDSSGRGFDEGQQIEPSALARDAHADVIASSLDDMDDDAEDGEHRSVMSAPSVANASEVASSSGLSRQSTLLTVGANPARRSKELNRLLGKSGLKRLSSGLSVGSAANELDVDVEKEASKPEETAKPSAGRSRSRSASVRSAAASMARTTSSTSSAVVLEQTKARKSRVELDLTLASELLVEGGTLKGNIEVCVRSPRDGEGSLDTEIWLGNPKIRVVGFEEVSSYDARHIFYHHAKSILSMPSPKSDEDALPLSCFDMMFGPDQEGYHKARSGTHSIPFKLVLPIGKGAKGSWKGKQGVIRYIVIASVKLKSAEGADRSIAHFYRHVEVYPYFNPAIMLASALKPIVSKTSKGLFMGGSGKVDLEARLHRATWVAGQRCYVDVKVDNDSSKKIKSLTLSLIRTTTIFRPRPWLSAGNGHDPDRPGDVDIDPDACQTQTTRKKVADATLEMGKKAHRAVTAKGTWMGVDKGESAEFSHSLLVPAEALSILRGRHLEVSYHIRVSVGGTLSTDISTEVPIRIINFVSIDPPPGHTGGVVAHTHHPQSMARSWSIDQLRPSKSRSAMPTRPRGMDRMSSMDSLQISDLNRPHPPDVEMARLASADSLRTSTLALSETNDPSTTPYRVMPSYSDEYQQPRAAHVVGKTKERQLQHQMSLDCISSAIASASARRERSRTESGLRQEVAQDRPWDPHADDENVLPPEAAQEEAYYYDAAPSDGRSQSRTVQLDDLDEIPDQFELEEPPAHDEDGLHADDSDDELATFIYSTRFDQSVDESMPPPTRPPPSPYRSHDVAKSPAPSIKSPTLSKSPATASRSVPASPSSRSASRSHSSARGSDDSSAKPQSAKVCFATPGSPVKGASAAVPRHEAVVVGPGTMPTARLVKVPLAQRPLPQIPVPAASKSSARPVATDAAVPGAKGLSRTGAVAKKSSARTLRKTRSAGDLTKERSMPPSSLANSPPDLDSSASHSSPSVDGAKTPSPLHSPMEVEVEVARPGSTQGAAFAPEYVQARHAKLVKAAPGAMLPPQSKRLVLPSVRSKIAALETRQGTLAKLATSNSRLQQGRPRADSIASESEASFGGNLTRANSLMSFKAPMLRKDHGFV